MLQVRKRTLVTVFSSLMVVLLVAGVWLFGNTSSVDAAEELAAITQASADPGLLGEGYLTFEGDKWGRGPMGKLGSASGIDYPELLADALGITVEELQEAHEMARVAAIEKAVEAEIITQEQADEMLVWGGIEGQGFGFPGQRGGLGRGCGPRGRGMAPQQASGFSAKPFDGQALLADALGVSVEELEAAREEANQVALEKAVEAGVITQEQADAILSRRALMRYLDRETLLAEALGMSVEDLQAARAEGETLSTLLEAQGLDALTVREALTEAHETALAQAVEDGVITQEQADNMPGLMGGGFGPRNMPGGRMMRPGGRGMRGGPGGRDGGDGRMPWGPGMPGPDADQDGDDDSGIRWHAPSPGAFPAGDDA
jgi:lambda repressor-like predicted transcriptional regulator